jgi:hypothetical protein
MLYAENRDWVVKNRKPWLYAYLSPLALPSPHFSPSRLRRGGGTNCTSKEKERQGERGKRRGERTNQPGNGRRKIIKRSKGNVKVCVASAFANT